MNRVKAAGVALLVAIGLVVAVQQPAQASWSSCHSGNICFFYDSGGNGCCILAYALPSTTQAIPMPAGWNDVVSSVWNRTSKTAYLCEDNPCSNGYVYTLYSGSMVSWYAWATWNDTISAWYRSLY